MQNLEAPLCGLVRQYHFEWSPHRNSFNRPAKNYAYHVRSAVLTAVNIKCTVSSGMRCHVIKLIVTSVSEEPDASFFIGEE
jgi:hypothetical protein